MRGKMMIGSQDYSGSGHVWTNLLCSPEPRRRDNMLSFRWTSQRSCGAAGVKRVKFRFWVSDPFKIEVALTAGESVTHKNNV